MRRSDSPTRSQEEATLSAYARVFAVAWAVYALMHEALTNYTWLRVSHPDKLALGLGVCLAALLVLGGPGSAVRLTLLCLAVIADKLYYAPFLPNHMVFTIFVNATVIAGCVYRLIRPAPGLGAAASAARLWLPAVRLELICLYFWAVVHKLNRDYFDPSVSCGWQLYTESVGHCRQFFGIGPPLADWMQYPCLIGAVGIEAAIPMCLVFRRTRKAGLLLGLVFHFMLTLHENFYINSFSYMLFGCYMVFLPAGSVMSIAGRWSGSRIHRMTTSGGGAGAFALAAGVLGLYAAVLLAVGAQRGDRGVKLDTLDLFRSVTPYTLFFVWLGWAGLLLLHYLRDVVRQPPQPDDHRLLAAHPNALYVIVLLCFANGLCPYLGLKTNISYAMFSNLRTEDGLPNHLLLPNLYLVDWQHDGVVVLASNARQIPVSREGERMTWFEFRRQLLWAGDDLAVTYQRSGETARTITKADIDSDPTLAPPPWALRLVLWYKTIPPNDEPCPCRH